MTKIKWVRAFDFGGKSYGIGDTMEMEDHYVSDLKALGCLVIDPPIDPELPKSKKKGPRAELDKYETRVVEAKGAATNERTAATAKGTYDRRDMRPKE